MKKELFLCFSITIFLGCKFGQMEKTEVDKLWDKSWELSFSDKDSSLIVLDKLIELDSSIQSAHNFKMAIYCSMIKYDEAISECEILLKYNPDLAIEWLSSGVLYDIVGDKKIANERYNKSLKMFTEIIDTTNDQKKMESAYYNKLVLKKLLDDDSYIKDLEKCRKERPIIFDRFYKDFIFKSKTELKFNMMKYHGDRKP